MKLTKSQLNTASFLGRMILIEASEAGSGKVRMYRCTCECTPDKVYDAPSAHKAMAFVIKHKGHVTRVEHSVKSEDVIADEAAAYEEQKVEAGQARWAETGSSMPY